MFVVKNVEEIINEKSFSEFKSKILQSNPYYYINFLYNLYTNNINTVLSLLNNDELDQDQVFYGNCNGVDEYSTIKPVHTGESYYDKLYNYYIEGKYDFNDRKLIVGNDVDLHFLMQSDKYFMTTNVFGEEIYVVRNMIQLPESLYLMHENVSDQRKRVSGLIL